VAEVLDFIDSQRARWAKLRMPNGDPCWVGIAASGILVKRSKLGLMGPVVFSERNAEQAVQLMRALEDRFARDLTPIGLTSPLLRPVVNAIMHCNDLDEVSRILSSTLSEEWGREREISAGFARQDLSREELLAEARAIVLAKGDPKAIHHAMNDEGGQAQLRNVDRAVQDLVELANTADEHLVSGGTLPRGVQEQVVERQTTLRAALEGPFTPEQLRGLFVPVLLNNPKISEGARMAVVHVFDTLGDERRDVHGA